MKIKIYLFAICFFIFKTTTVLGQPDISESDPHRGIYFNKFLKDNTLTINSGANEIDTSNSILSVDVNHDGIFEKEDRVLQYCMDNHITTIVLYDLRNILGKGINAWNENTSQFEDLEEHLCRFMAKARNEYCINEIGAAGQGQGFWKGIQDAYSTPTPALRFTANERTNPYFSALENLADTSYDISNTLLQGSEEIKYFLRVGRFGLGDCHQRFNLLHEEYEFWNINDTPSYTAVDPTCVFQNCIACTNLAGNFVYPNIYEAGYYRVFVRALKAMKTAKLFVNNGLAINDPNYLKTEVYFQTPHTGFSVDEFQDLYSFIDGNPDISTSITPWTNCQKRLFDRNDDGVVDLDGIPYVDRVLNTEFARYPSPSNVNTTVYNIFGFPQNNATIPDVDHTDIHPLLNSESIALNGYDDYWGPWFNDGINNNIFEAEKQFYDTWITGEKSVSRSILPGEPFYTTSNDIHRGGAHWYTSSFLAPKNDLQLQQGSPRIFNVDNPICSDPSQQFSFSVVYNGPTEDGLVVDFWVTDCNGNDILGSSCSAAAPCVQTTTDIATYFTLWPNSKILQDYNVTIPSLPVCNFLIATMKVNYPGGCSYTYSENIFVGNAPTISAIGSTEFCEGDYVFIRCSSGGANANYSWFKDNLPIGGTISGEGGRQIRVAESGVYHCLIANGTQCTGQSNDITVIVHPNPHIQITADCGVSLNAFTLYADFSYGFPASTSGSAGVTYLWSTGEISNQIVINLTSSTYNNMTYSVTATTPFGCQRTDSKRVSNDLPVVQTLTATPHDATSLCDVHGSVELSYLTSPPFHAELFDGASFYTIPWIDGTVHMVPDLSPGNYTAYITESFGFCIASANFTIAQPQLAYPPQVSVITTNNICLSQSNGSITFSSITGAASANFTIEIYGLGITLPYISGMVIPNIPSGVYVIRVTDQFCNESYTSITISNSDSPIELEVTNVPVSCFGGNNGSSSILVTGGTSGYSYLWQNGQTINGITTQQAGSYSVIVTDALGCTASTFAEISQPDQLIYTVSENVYSCSNGLTTVVVSISGGTPYNNGTDLYHGFPSGWSQSSTSSNEYINTAVNSFQTFTIHDRNNCQLVIGITPVTINNIQVNFNHIDADCAGNLGSATAIPSNGIGPYTFMWSNSLGTSPTVNGLISGVYTCFVTDASGCSNSGSVQILGNALTVNLASTPILCFGGNSTITISATGGTTPYLGTGALNVTAGTYTYSVSDAIGCMGSQTITVSEPTPMISSSSSSVLTCFGGTTMVTVTATGGTAPYLGTGSFSHAAGSYSYTVTDANGCTTTTSGTVSQPLAVVASSSAGTIACNGGTTSVTVSATGGAAPYSGTGTFVGVAVGTYNYTVTDANGCSSSTSGTVIQPTAVSASSLATAILCFGGVSTVMVSATGGTAPYTGTGSFTAAAGTYSYNVSDANNCSASTSVIITPPTNVTCCATYPHTIGDPGEPNFNSPFTNITGGFYNLNSSVVLTQDFIIDNCTIAIAAGVTIDVGSHHLIINGSRLYACNQMWGGIIVSQPNGNVEVINSSIEDAQYGIKANDGTFVNVDGSNFLNDYVGIYFSNTGTAGIASITGTVTGSTFSSSNLKTAFVGQSPTPLTHSLTGIFIENNTFINIGTGGIQDNVFSEMNMGIYSRSSNVNVEKSIFRLLLQYDNYVLPFVWGQVLGTGIYAVGNESNFINITGHNSNLIDFRDCLIGIRVWGMSTDCQSNKLLSCDRGIDVSYQTKCRSHVFNNYLNCNYFGIIALLNDYATSFAIYDNTLVVGSHYAIDGTYPYSIAILLSDEAVKNHGRMVKNNVITLNEFARHGIYANATSGYTIDHNYVHFNDVNTNLTGISLSKSSLCTINCNSVSGSGSTFTNDKQSAMWFQDSPENTISCNTVTSTYTGIGFMGTCVGGIGNNFRANDFGEHNIGLYYKGTATRVDHQDFKGNHWYFDNYSIYGAWDENIPYANIDKYRVNQNGPRIPNGQIMTNHPTPDADPNITEVWPLDFIRDDNSGDENCGSNHLPQSDCIVDIGGGDGGSDRRAARNQEGSQDFDEETKWKTRVSLYEKLLIEPNYLDSDTVYVSFFHQMAGSYLEKIASLNKEKNDLFVNQESLLQTIETRIEIINSNSQMIRACDSILHSDGLTDVVKDSVKFARYSIVQNTSQLLTQNNSAIALVNTAIDNKSDIMNADNAVINSTKIYEQNEKLINEVFLIVVTKNQFDLLMDYATQILSIALQCPLSGGPSVYKARTLALMIDPSLRYDDEQACYQSGYAWKLGQQKLNLDMTFDLYPNPTSNKVKVIYKSSENAKICIFDEVGDLVMLEELQKDNNEIEIDVSSLINGVYICKFMNGNSSNVKHLVIIK